MDRLHENVRRTDIDDHASVAREDILDPHSEKVEPATYSDPSTMELRQTNRYSTKNSAAAKSKRIEKNTGNSESLDYFWLGVSLLGLLVSATVVAVYILFSNQTTDGSWFTNQNISTSATPMQDLRESIKEKVIDQSIESIEEVSRKTKAEINRTGQQFVDNEGYSQKDVADVVQQGTKEIDEVTADIKNEIREVKDN